MIPNLKQKTKRKRNNDKLMPKIYLKQFHEIYKHHSTIEGVHSLVSLSKIVLGNISSGLGPYLFGESWITSLNVTLEK